VKEFVYLRASESGGGDGAELVLFLRTHFPHLTKVLGPTLPHLRGHDLVEARLMVGSPEFQETQAFIVEKGIPTHFFEIRREYTKEDTESAEVFRLKINPCFEPAGEECGTRYDDSASCSIVEVVESKNRR